MTKPDAVVFDVDSTLAHTMERAKRLINPEDHEATDWLAYALASGDDPETSTAHLARLTHRLGIKNLIVTFRPEKATEVTAAWLAKQGIEYDKLCLSRDDRSETTVEYKVRTIRELSQDYNILMHFDDAWEICAAVERELGIPAVCVRSYDPKKFELLF